MTAVSTISCLSCIIADLFHVTHAFIDNGIIISHNYDHSLVTANVFWYIGSITIYSLLIARLYLTFQTTSYALSNCLTVFIGLLISISALCGIYYCAIIASVQDEFEVVVLNRPATIILEINDFILNTTLLILFVYKLKCITAEMHDYDKAKTLLLNSDDNDYTLNTPSMQSRNITSFSWSSSLTANKSVIGDVELDQHQSKFMRVITRHTLLGSFVIFANQLFWMGYIYDVYIIRDITINLYPAICYSLRSTENLINIMVLYLSLKINDNMYFKLCALCHKGCYKCNVKQTQRTITKRLTIKQLDL